MKCCHLRNSATYNAQSVNRPSVLQQVQRAFKRDRAMKINQFVCVFHMLIHGRSMLEYESMRGLFKFLRMPNLNVKHWSDNSGWLIADYLHAQVMRKTREVLAAATYIALTCDEVTTIDNQSWINIHVYTVCNYYREPILISLERLTEGASAAKLALVIVNALMVQGGLSSLDIKRKFLSFGADGAAVFPRPEWGYKDIAGYLRTPHAWCTLRQPSH